MTTSRSTPSRRIVLAVLAVGALAACAKLIPREDWGAVTPDATIRVTTVDGERRSLRGVTVFSEALEGIDAESGDSVRFALDQIEFIESPRNVALPILAAVAATVTTIGIVAAMGKSGVEPARTAVSNSCPFIYSFDGEGYQLDSETFAGAITRGVQRTDVDNLDRLRVVDGAYRLLLTNERLETQYIDAITLMVIDHPGGSSVYPDVVGEPRVFVAGVAPTSADKLRGGDARPDVVDLDGRFWQGDPIETVDVGVASELRDGMVLTFPRPRGDRALLAVHAQNTEYAPYALKTFLELQGDDLVDWYREVDRSAEVQGQLRSWVMREGTLHVSVWVGGAWRLQNMLLDVGPHLAKTQVARLDLSGVEGDEVRVRLEAARGLWTLDWVSLGVEAETEPSIDLLTPTIATGTAGRDLRATLSEIDDRYLTTLEGDRVELSFLAPALPEPGDQRTVLVRSTGYYHIYTNHAGPAQPDVVERILTEPLFGNRYMLGRLREAQAQAQLGGSER